MLTLFDFPDSGNGYKIRLLLTQLGEQFEYHPVDILAGESRTAEFLAMNPNGKIPVLRLDDATCLAESNAILYYLADGTRFFPTSRLARSMVLQWLFFEQYSHEPNIATRRFMLKHADPAALSEAILQQKPKQGYGALSVMEKHLRNNEFFVAGAYSIADIALYAYTHVADEGGFDLSSYQNVLRWCARVAAQPGYRRLYAEW